MVDAIPIPQGRPTVPFFDFNAPFGDARLEELKVLAAAADEPVHGLMVVSHYTHDTSWVDLFVSLVFRGLLTTFSYRETKQEHDRTAATPGLCDSYGTPGDSMFERKFVSAKMKAIGDLYDGDRFDLYLTHEGRVRLSELKQSLRSGREREPFGILWDTRHWQSDLQVAIVDAKPDAPLAVAYLDMNGLKAINDAHGHPAGDQALRAYFQAVASALGNRGEAYRVSRSGGGDEVLAIIPRTDADKSLPLIQLACRSLMSERIVADACLSIAAGIAVTTDPAVTPTALHDRAEEVQRTAKERSRQGTPRPSVVAVDGRDDLVVIPHDVQ
jgi:diguanylate cyclase (GGDEF)-like protein